MARKYHWANGEPERIDIVGFDGAFHGRSYAAVFAAGNPSYVEGFGPALPGYLSLPFGDMEAVKAAIASPTTAAVIIEPVQGEGGARALPEVCLTGLREHCDAHGVLLIHDEIQCGLGRTGKLFAHEWAPHAAPDIMCVAKALGDGFPVGACLATMKAASGHEGRRSRLDLRRQSAGDGGRPRRLRGNRYKPETLEHVRDVANYFGQQLAGLRDRHPGVIAEVRGKGLLIGLEARCRTIASSCRRRATSAC